MGTLDAIVVLLSLAVFSGSSILVFLKERKKGFAFLLMGAGFGTAFLAQLLILFWRSDFVFFLHLAGMAVAAFAFLGYLWPRIREQVGTLLARAGMKAGAEAPAAAAPAASPPPPAPSRAGAPPRPAPPMDLPPRPDDDATVPPPPAPPPPPG